MKNKNHVKQRKTEKKIKKGKIDKKGKKKQEKI